jgi:hypothetical protein
VTEERLGQAGWLSPSDGGAQVSSEEAGFTGSVGGIRVLPANAKMELGDQERKKKPFRVESSNPSRFRAWANHSYPERYMVATVRQHGAGCSGGLANRQTTFLKTPKGGQRGRPLRGGERTEARFGSPPKTLAMCKSTPLACERKAT